MQGALLFCSERLREFFDLSLFIDTDDDVRLSRRVLKNAQREPDRQIPLAELLRTYENKTKPAFEKYIEPTKKHANIIIPNYGFSPDQFELDRMTIQGVDVIVTDIKSTVTRKVWWSVFSFMKENHTQIELLNTFYHQLIMKS